MFLGDSRCMDGPGIVPAQDHRRDIELDVRSARVAVRIIDSRTDPLVRHIYEDGTQGDIQGLSMWALDGRNTVPRPCVMWRHAWPSMVEEFGDSLTEEPPPADAFPSFPSTPSGSSPIGSQDSGGWLIGKNPIGDPTVWGGGNNNPATWQRL